MGKMYRKGFEYITHILNKVNLTEWGIFITNTQSFRIINWF